MLMQFFFLGGGREEGGGLVGGGGTKVHYGKCTSNESNRTGQLSLFLLYIVFVKGMARLPD